MNLQKYIDQLLLDIEAATRNAAESQPLQAQEESEESADLLLWATAEGNIPTRPLDEWCGIKQAQMPPDTSLTSPQITSLLTALKKLLEAYNCPVVFQINVPPNLQYRVIRERFNQQVPIFKTTHFFFSFCDDMSDRKDCLLGSLYCHCSFFDAFFERFSSAGEEEEEELTIDVYRRYLLKRRYGDQWYKYIRSEDDDAWEEDEDNLGESPN